MINQLRKVFKSLLIYNEGSHQLDSNFKWFSTDQQEIIGIHQDELSVKDSAIIEAFLTPYNTQFPVLTAKEEMWHALIHSPEAIGTNPFEVVGSYRFISFSIKKDQTDPITFKDALHELFGKKLPILWRNGHEGIIIEENVQREDQISYEQIIDILMSDLYVKITFFVGSFKENLDGVHHYYQTVMEASKVAMHFSTNAVMTYAEVVPYLFINQMPETLRQEIGNTVLQDYIDDEETLKMIKTFVQCNLNVSETSKALHMHRNSLQYRLDRFYEKTGIELRQFHQAMTAYLAYIAKN